MLDAALSLQQEFKDAGIVICGVATDDPTKPWTSPHKRIWRYPHTESEETMVAQLAQKHDIPVWRGRINTQDFYEEFTKRWTPDVCYMGVFGQKIPEAIWSSPLYGFYNFHTCAGRVWPSNAGGGPIETMMADGEKQGAVAMHAVDNDWDHGELVAFSDFFSFSPQESVTDVHKRIGPLAAEMMKWHVSKILGVSMPESKPRFVAEEAIAAVNATAHDVSLTKKRLGMPGF
ncbi:MAG: hypothetical protein PHQ46_07925 [Negativicutes bacterium]|nr:hypothetical protein [Negativicutes bacterium]